MFLTILSCSKTGKTVVLLNLCCPQCQPCDVLGPDADTALVHHAIQCCTAPLFCSMHSLCHAAEVVAAADQLVCLCAQCLKFIACHSRAPHVPPTTRRQGGTRHGSACTSSPSNQAQTVFEKIATTYRFAVGDTGACLQGLHALLVCFPDTFLQNMSVVLIHHSRAHA